MPMEIVITEAENDCLDEYTLEVRVNNKWESVFSGKATTTKRVKMHRFGSVWADAVRITIKSYKTEYCGIAELGVYNERR